MFQTNPWQPSCRHCCHDSINDPCVPRSHITLRCYHGKCLCAGTAARRDTTALPPPSQQIPASCSQPAPAFVWSSVENNFFFLVGVGFCLAQQANPSHALPTQTSTAAQRNRQGCSWSSFIQPLPAGHSRQGSLTGTVLTPEPSSCREIRSTDGWDSLKR